MSAHEASKSGLLALYIQKRPDLVRFFTKRTGSIAQAEDIVQDIYLKVQQASTDGVINASAYLYRLGLNVMVDRHRSEVSGRRRDQSYVEVQGVTVSGLSVSDAPSAEDEVDARRRLEKVVKAIDALPQQTRRVFTMHRIEGLSHLEIAEALGVSRSAVEKRMIAALRLLSQELA